MGLAKKLTQKTGTFLKIQFVVADATLFYIFILASYIVVGTITYIILAWGLLCGYILKMTGSFLVLFGVKVSRGIVPSPNGTRTHV